MKFLSKLNHFIFGYFDPVKLFFDNKNNFQGDLSSVSAKTATPATGCQANTAPIYTLTMDVHIVDSSICSHSVRVYTIYWHTAKA